MPTLDAATYRCSWENGGWGRYIPTFPRPWALFIVQQSEGRRGNCLRLIEKGRSVSVGVTYSRYQQNVSGVRATENRNLGEFHRMTNELPNNVSGSITMSVSWIQFSKEDDRSIDFQLKNVWRKSNHCLSYTYEWRSVNHRVDSMRYFEVRRRIWVNWVLENITNLIFKLYERAIIS